VRIIGGSARGRTLKGPGRLELRPTPDRVREALFSILASDVPGARFLDLFAGTGAVGAEALSRGATLAVLVERDARAASLIRDNLDRCGLTDRARLLELPVANALDRLAAEGGQFDLAYIDPPYADSAARQEALERLSGHKLLTPDARLVLELPSREPPPEVAGLHQAPVRRYGDTALALYTLALET